MITTSGLVFPITGTLSKFSRGRHPPVCVLICTAPLKGSETRAQMPAAGGMACLQAMFFLRAKMAAMLHGPAGTVPHEVSNPSFSL